ncbi:50S ribosomal protein L19 [bacterium]|nr:50S ribosomal protein L19 [bacterium]
MKARAIVEQFEQKQIRSDLPDFRPGDTLRVFAKVKEGDRTREQRLEGICIRRAGGGLGETFTVRKISHGVGVERTYLLNSPIITRIERVREGHVRRARLYYLRDRVGRKASRVRSRKRSVAEPVESES